MSDGKRLEVLVDFLAEYAKPAAKVLVPVSGSDSSLVYWLCAQAFPKKTIGVHFGDRLKHADWLVKLGGELRQLPGPDPSRHPTHYAEEVYRWSEAQRIALDEWCWLLGSRNRTEQVFGTFSLMSRIATVLPIRNVWKTDVMRLGEAIGMPKVVLDSSRKADPDCGRPKDVEEIGLERVDIFLKIKVGELPDDQLSGFAPAELAYLERTYSLNRYKGALPVSGPVV